MIREKTRGREVDPVGVGFPNPLCEAKQRTGGRKNG